MTQAPQKDITDVADWFLNRESMPHKKLQKLCYYAVAWTYTLLDTPLCKRDEFQAWAHGPVNKHLYKKYRKFGWKNIPSPKKQTPFHSDYTDLLETVWNTYGEFNGHQLESLTHDEAPWILARGNLPITAPSNNLISVKDMKKYYKQVFDEGQND
jgi:uncharacterized phage-associated protein